jgi:uncharacterized protein YbaP (TraB family)
MKKTILTAAIALCATLWPQISLAQFVFRITGNGLKEPSYIIGTVHTLDGALLDSIPEYQEAVAQCRQLYTEKDYVDKQRQVEYNQRAQESLILPDSMTIFEHLGPEKSEVLTNVFSEKFNTNLRDSVVKPLWNYSPSFYVGFIWITLMTKSGMIHTGVKTPIDKAIIQQAYDRGWTVGELDEIGENGTILPVEMPSLEAMTDSLMKFIERYDEILESYKKESETVRKMEEFARSCNFEDFDVFSCEKYQNVEAFSKAIDIIFTKRNEKWLPKIKQAMQEAPTLFDFGAGHLVGDDGVLKMLRDAGYEVTLLTKKRE